MKQISVGIQDATSKVTRVGNNSLNVRWNINAKPLIHTVPKSLPRSSGHDSTSANVSWIGFTERTWVFAKDLSSFDVTAKDEVIASPPMIGPRITIRTDCSSKFTTLDDQDIILYALSLDFVPKVFKSSVQTWQGEFQCLLYFRVMIKSSQLNVKDVTVQTIDTLIPSCNHFSHNSQTLVDVTNIGTSNEVSQKLRFLQRLCEHFSLVPNVKEGLRPHVPKHSSIFHSFRVDFLQVWTKLFSTISPI
mmetsp:Transcript_22716/g.32466  ORF Transcript_22716/g.32466 Transcript_22716/m.32466 type:complete len:247 (+) Transcript_22716:810-1550(+)